MLTPSLIISSTRTAVPGAPIPWEAALSGTPDFCPVTIRYSRTWQTSRDSSQSAEIRSTRAGSPQTKRFGAMSPGLQPVIGWASLKMELLGGRLAGDRNAEIDFAMKKLYWEIRTYRMPTGLNLTFGENRIFHGQE